MCTTCGCGTDEVWVEHGPGHRHPHRSDHEHGDEDKEPRTHTVTLEQRVLAKNDELAGRNRRHLAEQGIAAVNLMSSPGAGKTSLLERTLTDARLDRAISVIEGDQETTFDAQRIRAAGARAIQSRGGNRMCLYRAQPGVADRAAASPAEENPALSGRRPGR